MLKNNADIIFTIDHSVFVMPILYEVMND